MEGRDEYSHAWYRKQFGGIVHRLNQQANEQLDAFESRKALAQRIAILEAGREADAVRIGQLMDKIAEMNERLDKARDYMLKKNGQAV